MAWDKEDGEEGAPAAGMQPGLRTQGGRWGGTLTLTALTTPPQLRASSTHFLSILKAHCEHPLFWGLSLGPRLKVLVSLVLTSYPAAGGYLAVYRPGSGSHGHSPGRSVTCDLDVAGGDTCHIAESDYVHTGTHI